ncbi:MAG: P-II family nitrogen regulator [Oscillospiraceae bacterium]
MSRLYLMITVTSRVAGAKRFLDFYQAYGVPVVLTALGRGTASDDILSTLGLEATEKAVLFSVVTPEKKKLLLKELVRTLHIAAPGRGIAMSLPMSSIGGRTAMNYLLSGSAGDVPLPEDDKEEGTTMSNPAYQLIIAVTNRGYTDQVMEAARSAGAGGGTVIHARSTGADGESKFFGMSIAEEREMLFIVASAEDKNAIMQAIMARAGMETKAQAVAFSLPLDEVAGLRTVDLSD